MEVIGDVVTGSTASNGYVVLARVAGYEWRRLSVTERIARVSRLRPAIKHYTDRLVAALGAMGKPETEVLLHEIGVVLRVLKYYRRHGERLLARRVGKDLIDRTFFPFKRFSVAYEPDGVFGIIPAWNQAFNFTFGDAIPALIAGNTVIAKLSEYTSPDLARLMREIVSLARLDNVFQIVSGGPEVGKQLVQDCDGIHFTGSTAVGLAIEKRCNERRIPFIGEMGGFDPMIVFPDGATSRAVNAAVWGRFSNSGQNCLAVKAIYYVGTADQARAFAARVARIARKLRPGTDYGPIINGKQFWMIREQLRKSLVHGVECLSHHPDYLMRCLDSVTAPPWHFPPVVLFAPAARTDLPILSEETFGPILPIIPVTEDQAVQLINRNPLSLGCSIWTSDDSRIQRLINALDVPNVLVRDVLAHYSVIGLPFGGRRISGSIGRQGSRHGSEGLLCFGRPKSIFRAPKLALPRELYWFPYGRFEWLFRFLVKRVL